jgi:hypothetical protein
MKNYFSFIILSFCAWFSYLSIIKKDNLPIYLENNFKSYIVKFNVEASLRNKDIDLTKLKISFDNLESQIAACYYGIDYLKVIKVDRTWWRKMSIEEKEATIFHELGHCALRRRIHYDIIDSDGCPKSLMHSSHTLKNCYFKNRSKYLDELFSEK